jgi:hypothetical protein
MPMKQKYTGGCQCGRVRFEVEAEINEVMSCNCSRCAKVGWLLTFVPSQDFKLTQGQDATTEFLFHNHNIHHRFCATCGIQPYAFGKAPNGAEMTAVNVRCLDGVDVGAFQVKTFDGKSL